MIGKEEFCDLIKTYEKSIYYVAYSVVKNDSDAEEVISDAILKAYTSIESLRSKEAFKTWMLRIVHNMAIDYIRKNSRCIPADEINEECHQSMEKQLVNKRVVRDAVEKLNQPYRTIINLYYFEDLSVFEVAHIIGSNPVTVRKQLSRARAMLQKLLKGDTKYE